MVRGVDGFELVVSCVDVIQQFAEFGVGGGRRRGSEDLGGWVEMDGEVGVGF